MDDGHALTSFSTLRIPYFHFRPESPLTGPLRASCPGLAIRLTSGRLMPTPQKPLPSVAALPPVFPMLLSQEVLAAPQAGLGRSVS